MIFFGYTRDGCYKSMEPGSASELNRKVLISSVQEIRRDHPRMGGKDVLSPWKYGIKPSCWSG
ncbi:MAG: hypothetical protein LBK58_12260 [Prevotellaceae bacterium]|nr:hypothetical protein [Prevotellaceae bacterium]